MKKTLYVALASALFFGSAAFALADNPQPLSFYCDSYSTNFVEGQAYTPTDGGKCNFQMSAFDPSATNVIEVYRGVVGNNPTFVKSILRTDCALDYCTMDNVPFGIDSPQPSDAYFAVGYILGTDASYIQTGTNPPPSDEFQIVNWHWGTPATVTADTVTANVGNVPATFTATISGFINGENLGTSGITGSASCTTTATNASPVGDYPITCTQGSLSSTKYGFAVSSDPATTANYVAGTLHLVTPPPPAPTCSLTASPTSIVQGNSSTLTFTSTNATAGNINNGVGAVAASGTKSVSPPTTATYTDTVTGDGGTATCSATVTVTPPVVTDHQAPVIVITNPLKNGVYAKTDSVLLTATVTDASALATTTYWFGTKKINPAQPLPLSTVSTPSVQNVSVSATDVYGNTSTTTLKFFVVKNTNSCLLDIIQVLVLITQDKTFPDKPTLQNLVSDCSALIKGLHRYDDNGHSGHGY